jgi:hypothetical protein
VGRENLNIILIHSRTARFNTMQRVMKMYFTAGCTAMTCASPLFMQVARALNSLVSAVNKRIFSGNIYGG